MMMDVEIEILGVIYSKITTPSGKRTFYAPKPLTDQKKTFPLGESYEDEYYFVRSGIARHDVMRDPREISQWEEVQARNEHYPLRATSLVMVDANDWWFECFGVLSANGWLGKGGQLLPHVLEAGKSASDPEMVKSAPLDAQDALECYLAECAATVLTSPLSRVWYAANLLSLYYFHEDDVRFGYLMGEYNARLRYERDTLRGKKMIDHSRAGGKERARSLSPKTALVLHEIERHTKAGQTVANAARLAAQAGIGASPEANRKLWHRHVKK